MIETIITTAAITGMLWLARRHIPTLKEVWSEAKLWEKGAMLLIFLPIPGPVDEVVGLLVIRRILKRRPA